MHKLKEKYDEKYKYRAKVRFATTLYDEFVQLVKIEAAKRNLNYNDFITIAVSEYLEKEKEDA